VRNARFIVLAPILLAVALAFACTKPLPVTTTGASPTDTAGIQTTTSITPTTSATSPYLSDVSEAVAHMTLREEAAQVLLVSFDGTSVTAITKKALSEAPPGGVLLLGRNVTGAAQLRSLAAALQQTVASAGGAALFVAADEEGGPVMRVKEGVPTVPAARDVGASSTPALAETLARGTGLALLGQGVNMVLAPVADVVDDPDSFLFERSYGSTPEIVSSFVAAVTRGYEDAGMVTVVKHFPGHGSALANSHTSVPVSAATRAEFKAVHLPPFEAAIAAGAEGIMIGHFVAPAFDPFHVASQSASIVNDLLRNDLGFDGLVVSDDLVMAAAAGRPGAVGTASVSELGTLAVAGLAAGCDLLITTSTLARQVAIEQAIMDSVRTGALSRERLDQAVASILLVKATHSLPVRGVTSQK
jgi:beta-N-acetylhexosaminidase